MGAKSTGLELTWPQAPGVLFDSGQVFCLSDLRFFFQITSTLPYSSHLSKLIDSVSVRTCFPVARKLPDVENTGGWRTSGCTHGRVRQGIECSHGIRPLGEGRRTQWLPCRAVTKQDLEAEQGAGCARQQGWVCQETGVDCAKVLRLESTMQF